MRRSLKQLLFSVCIGGALGVGYLAYNWPGESKVVYRPPQEEKEIYGRLVKLENRFIDKMSDVVMQIRDLTGEIDRGFEISLNDRTKCVADLEEFKDNKKSISISYSSLPSMNEIKECIKNEYLARVNSILSGLSADDIRKKRLELLLTEVGQWE